MIPDRSIVRQLQAIEKDLTVIWDHGNERWAIYHNLPHNLGRLDELVDKMSRELRLTYLEQGIVVDPEQAGRLCLQAVKHAALVCYVTEENGDYRPLDGRIVEKFRRMDYLRQNLEIKDWRELLAARRYAAERSQELEKEDFYQYQSKDAVLQRVLSDVLWGTHVTRSVIVEGGSDEGTEAGASEPPDQAGGDDRDERHAGGEIPPDR
jgi:hypothetical protein